MNQKTKTGVQIFSVLLLSITTLVLLAVIINPGTHSLTVVAQEPKSTPSYPISISEETLAAFGLSLDSIQASSALTYDLEVKAIPTNIALTNGDPIQFNVSITNLGPNPGSYILFYVDYGTDIKDVNYQFSVTEVISDGKAKPTWLLPGPIDPPSTVVVTVTGKVEAASDCDFRMANNVSASPFNVLADPISTNNIDGVEVDVTNQFRCIYLPLVIREPTPTPTPTPTSEPVFFSDDFHDDDSGWYEGSSDSDHCYSSYDNGRYRIELDSSDRTCFRPAPSEANRKYGSFEVAAYLSEGGDDFAYGIYSNGAGGDTLYRFRIWPNSSCSQGGSWELHRKSTRKLSGDCHPAIKRGTGSSATNVLKLTHTSNGKISVYVNDTLLGTYTDSSQLTGTGTGLYVRSDDEDIVVKFDNFTVYR